MKSEHFNPEYQFQFSKTHFVNQIFTKFENWGNFFLAGKLTEEGVWFIDENLTELQPMEYLIYKKLLSEIG